MIPVLAVDSPDAARATLTQVFGFKPAKGGRVAFGDQEIVVVRSGESPANMTPLRLDHVAFAVEDVDAISAQLKARGARLAAAFTPDGPSDIPEFWDHGVRFVFFDGPDGWPIEFCARCGVAERRGLGHLGIRTQDVDAREAELVDLGAEPIARFEIKASTSLITISFVEWSGHLVELFDEASSSDPHPSRGWIGFVPGGKSGDRELR